MDKCLNAKASRHGVCEPVFFISYLFVPLVVRHVGGSGHCPSHLMAASIVPVYARSNICIICRTESTLEIPAPGQHSSGVWFIPTGSIHRIENYYKKPVKIIEVQTGSILKESDIIRFSDMYGRIKQKKNPFPLLISFCRNNWFILFFSQIFFLIFVDLPNIHLEYQISLLLIFLQLVVLYL